VKGMLECTRKENRSPPPAKRRIQGRTLLPKFSVLHHTEIWIGRTPHL